MENQSQEFDPTATSVFSLNTVEEVADAPMPLSARDQDAVNALPAGSALLIVQRGPNSGARFLLDAEVTNAGRSPRADIFLDDVTVHVSTASSCLGMADIPSVILARSMVPMSTVNVLSRLSSTLETRYRSASTA